MSRLDDLLHSLRRFESLPAIAGDVPSRTYSELLGAIDDWSSQLARRGITAGSVVALQADYSFDAIALLFAVLKGKGVLVLVPPAQQASRFLQDSCAQWLCVMDPEGAAHWNKVEPAADHALLQGLRAQRRPGIVIFSSGSTGSPKAALQDVERFLGKFMKPGRRMRTLAFLLFDHVAGLDTLL